MRGHKSTRFVQQLTNLQAIPGVCPQKPSNHDHKKHHKHHLFFKWYLWHSTDYYEEGGAILLQHNLREANQKCTKSEKNEEKRRNPPKNKNNIKKIQKSIPASSKGKKDAIYDRGAKKTTSLRVFFFSTRTGRCR